MNKVILVGNLTRDPEMQTTSGGVSLCKMTVAVNRSYTNANGEREADFINVITWRALAENCGKYLVKGRKVAVAGSIQTRSYEGQDGVKKFSTEVVADDVEFLTPVNSGGDYAPRDGGYAPPPPRNNNAGAANAAPAKKPVAELEPVEDETLPF